MTNYVVQLPSFDIEANSYEEAIEQAEQIFLDYPSTRTYLVRKFGEELVMAINQHTEDKVKLP